MIGKGAVKVTLYITFQLALVSTEKSLVKSFAMEKKDLPLSCLLVKSASILDQANHSYSGFCDIRCPLCPVSAKNF